LGRDITTSAGIAMNCRFTVVALLLAVFIVGCGKKEEIEPVGTWIGQTAGRTGRFRETWTFKDGNITVEDADAGYTYKVDATKEPKQIDITAHFPGKGEDVRMGIYKIEKDTLTICSIVTSKAKADAKRPEEFYPTERDDVIALTFGRKK